jgi:hypothetical protein
MGAEVKFNRYKTSKALLSHFSFLATDYGLSKRSIGGADEMVHRYHDAALYVQIALSYPDLPFVEVLLKEAKPRAYCYSARRSPVAKSLARRYYRTLEHGLPAPAVLVALQEEFIAVLVPALRKALDEVVAGRRVLSGPEWVTTTAYV